MENLPKKENRHANLTDEQLLSFKDEINNRLGQVGSEHDLDEGAALLGNMVKNEVEEEIKKRGL